MTMPETIWALPPIDIDGFTFPAETTTPNFPNAHEYVLRSSVQGLIDAALQEAVSTPAPPLRKGVIVDFSVHPKNHVAILNMAPPDGSRDEMVRFRVEDIPAVIAALRKIGGAE